MKTPTTEELEIISRWPRKDVHGLVAFLEGLWWMPEHTITFSEDSEYYYLELDTMGWKGNEEIIHALMDNVILWYHHWTSSKPVGKYSFEFEKHESD